jgi:tetratricopeptide (TPR) repeat protein
MATYGICLNMIVKNESPVIGRCLDSVLPFIDTWVIVDTGSTDDTRELVRKHLRSKPGELHERPWKSFGHNRNEALQLASSSSDYLFFIDADEQLLMPPGFERPTLTGDGYYLNCKYAGMTYSRTALVATRLPWRWQGVVHEYLACGSGFKLSTLEGPTIHVSHDGARSRDPNTYLKDAALLEEVLRTNPESTRDTFYLAQSYRDSGQLAKSRDMYQRRAEMKGWEEEGWFALYQVAVMEERLGSDPARVSFSYLSAYQRRPSRAEPLVRLARYHRLRGEFELAVLYAERATSMSRPADLLFLDDATYRWSALDELAVAAFYSPGKKTQGRAALVRLIAENQFPERERARMLKNCEFYGVPLPAQPALAAQAREQRNAEPSSAA